MSTNRFFQWLITAAALLPLPLTAQSFTVIIQTTQQISCFGASNGQLSAVVDPPGGAYTYLWSDGSTGTQIGDLGPGAYTVQVQNAAGGTAVATAVLSEPAPLLVEPLTELPAPANPLGSVDVAVTGGIAPYAFQWIDANGNVFSNIEDLINAPAGEYSLTATDQNGCANQLSPVVLQLAGDTKEAAELGIRMFPNPAVEVVFIERNSGKPMTVEVFDAAGKLLQHLNAENGATAIDTKNWPSGLYTVSMQCADGHTSLRLLVLGR